MTSYYIKICIFFLLLGASFNSLGQSVPSIRWEPGISVSKKIDNRWSYNLFLQARQRFTDYGDGEQNIKTDRWNLKAFGTYALFGGSKISLGYMFRENNPFEPGFGYEHRITQQIAFISNLTSYRFAHKIRVEERIFPSDFFTRIRYKISSDFPLSGEKLDPGELYFIGGNELHYEFNGTFNELENRFTVGIGLLSMNKHKFQFDITSRYSDLLSNQEDHILQIATTYYLSF